MCYITKWHCGSKMCYQWGICVTNVLPLDKISLTIVLKKVVYFADYKHITLPLNATILIPYCVTTDPMRVTKRKRGVHLWTPLFLCYSLKGFDLLFELKKLILLSIILLHFKRSPDKRAYSFGVVITNWLAHIIVKTAISAIIFLTFWHKRTLTWP